MPTVQSEVNLKQSAKHVLPWRAQYKGAQSAVQGVATRSAEVVLPKRFNLKDSTLT